MLFNVPITKQMEPSNMKSGKPRKLGRVQKIFIFKGVGGVGGVGGEPSAYYGAG